MPEETWLNDSVFVVEGFLTPDECKHYIQLSEDVGYEDALVNTPQGQVRRADVRNNERVLFNDAQLAVMLWRRAEEFVPSEWAERTPIGINELFRFYRYDPGQQFNWHQDFPYERDNGESSLWTFMVYLNDDCLGGSTSFEDSYSDEPFDEFRIEPETGTALFFEHGIHHKGEPVTSGRKYVMRTDVMFSPED